MPSYAALDFLAMLGCWLALTVLALIGLGSLCIRRDSRSDTLVLFAFIGILASVPFAPPWDGGVRIYAATIPFMAMLPSIGLARSLAYRPGWHWAPGIDRRRVIRLPLTLCLVGALIVGPWAIHAVPSPAFSPSSVPDCTSGQPARLAWQRDTTVVISDSRRGARDVTRESLRQGLHEVELLYPQTAAFLEDLPPGTAFTFTYDSAANQERYVVGPQATLLAHADGEPHEVCLIPAGAPIDGRPWWRVE
jgi:hypothetical protein